MKARGLLAISGATPARNYRIAGAIVSGVNGFWQEGCDGKCSILPPQILHPWQACKYFTLERVALNQEGDAVRHANLRISALIQKPGLR